MALAAVSSILGPLIAATLRTPDAAGAWSATLTVLGTWLPVNTVVMPGTMEAVGATVEGAGAFVVFGDVQELGTKLALAAGSPPTDLDAIARWTGVGRGIVEHLMAAGSVDPAGFTAPGAGGPLTGTGAVTYNGAEAALGPLIVRHVGAEDAAGIGGWMMYGLNLAQQIAANASVLATPIGLNAPAGGGPITGTGSII